MPKVVVFTHLAPELASDLIAPAPPSWDVTVAPIDAPVPDKIAKAQTADFLILFPGVIEEEVVRSAPDLRLIQLVSAGFDRMPMDLCREMNIPVANNGGTNSIDVAEHTLALILGLYRLLPQMDQNVRRNAWKGIDSGQATRTINGKRVGIIGLGNIGQRVARLLAPFGVDLLYADAFPQPPEVEEELSVTRVDLDELLQRSDIVTLHVPLNEATHHLIGPRELGMMSREALLINTCRGPVVDETALTLALEEGKIRGAGLDVLDQEPPDPDNPLLTFENVLLSPHIAGVTRDTWRRRGEFIFENLARVWAGEEPEARVG